MNWEISYKIHSELLMLACPGDAGPGRPFPLKVFSVPGFE